MESLIREIEADALPEPLEVEFYGYPEYVDYGIGHYEYFGEWAYETQMVVRCEEVFWNEKDYTTTENEIIKDYLDSNFDSITRELEEQYS